MELSALQIVTTVVLIVAAGAVALFCDYLRNRSQQLQELAVELSVRKEMTGASPAPPAPSAATAAAARNARIRAREEKSEQAPAAIVDAPLPPAAAPAAPAEAKMNRSQRHSNEMVKPALASAAELTSVRGAARPRRRPVPPPDVPLPRLDEMNPRQALAEWLDQRAAKAPPRSHETVKLEEIVVAAPPRSRLIIEEPAPVTLIEEPAPVALIEEPAPVTLIEEPAPAALIEEPAPVAVLEEPAPTAALEAEAPVVETVSVPVLVDTTPAEEPAPAFVADIRPVADDDIRDVLRRALAKRSVPARVAEDRPASPAPEPVKAPRTLPSPAPAPMKKAVSVFLSTRKIDTIRREPEITVDQVAEELVEEMAAAEPRFEIIDGAAPSATFLEVVLPAGMHDHAILDRAIATGRPFRGLVISVGVNDVEGRSAHHSDLMQSIGFFVRSLLAEKEFACRAGDAEFVVVCPGLEGPEAQRRLNQIAEQLWDYQLRGVSTWSILFSWGGADVHHKPISEAIAMANDQMYTTRRGRRTVSVESLRPWRKAAM
jgi:hypothetical protein